MRFYIYQLKASDESQIFYIGKSFEGSNRLNEHISASKTRKYSCARKVKSILDRGATLIEEVLYWFDTEVEAFDKERELIAYYGRRDIKTGILLNHTDGGEGFVGYVISDVAKRKMSDAKKGNKINVGRKRPDIAEKFSKEITMFDVDGNILAHYTSARIAEADCNITFSNISQCCTGRNECTRTAEGDIRRFRIGKIYNNIDPVKFRQKAGLGEVGQHDMNGDLIQVFRNSTVAGKKTGLNSVSIRNCIHGKQQTCGGFIWKLIE